MYIESDEIIYSPSDLTLYMDSPFASWMDHLALTNPVITYWRRSRRADDRAAAERNGYEGALSADAAGIVASLYVINQLCWLEQSDKMIDHYYSLRDYASEHSEANEIYAAID